jgi:hypothetical protein
MAVPVQHHALASQKKRQEESTQQYQNLRVEFDIGLLTLACPLTREDTKG